MPYSNLIGLRDDFGFCCPFDKEAEFEGGEDAGGADGAAADVNEEDGGEGARG